MYLLQTKKRCKSKFLGSHFHHVIWNFIKYFKIIRIFHEIFSNFLSPTAPCSLAFSKHRTHERIYDKQFEAHIWHRNANRSISFLFFPCFSSLSLSHSYFFEFQYYSICTQAEETLRKERKIFFLFMRNVFLNYWHCVRLQVEETNRKLVKRTLENSIHFEIKLQHINFFKGKVFLCFKTEHTQKMKFKMQLNYFVTNSFHCWNPENFGTFVWHFRH